MVKTASPRLDQKAYWNGHGGQVWVQTQDLLDRLFTPFEARLCEAAQTANARNILDIGCGTGRTTLATADAIREQNGQCTGIDLSGPMIDAAQNRPTTRSAKPRFINDDAQTYTFEPKTYDMLISRFGVMFFSDPVAAMRNLHEAATANASLYFIVWRSPAENPFMTTAEEAAAPFLPDMPKRDTDAPGQFAFADDKKVRNILTQSGWTNINIEPIDIACELTEADLQTYITHLGPLGAHLPNMKKEKQAHIVQTVRAAFDPFVENAVARFIAACWVIRAEAS